MARARVRPSAAEKNCIISGNQLFSGGHTEACGKRPTMEDRSAIIGEFAGENTQFYGIFDGHGGSNCSTYVANNLHKTIANKLAQNETQNVFDIVQESLNEINEYATKQWANQGTTVAIAMIIDDLLYTANVGDSRILLVDRDTGNFQRLTVDHKASDPSEQSQIRSKLGTIVNDRVSGILALSRAIGDGAVSNYISCEAYQTENSFNHNQGLILACDGVWDVLQDSEAAALFCKAENAAAASKAIKEAAINSYTSDNVVVVCVTLQPKELQKQ